MAIEIRHFRKFEKNSLRGFLTIFMTNIGLEIREATVHEKEGRRWIGLPAKPYQDEQGETKYAYIVKFPDKAKYEQFQAAALKALDEHLKPKAKDIPDDEIPF